MDIHNKDQEEEIQNVESSEPMDTVEENTESYNNENVEWNDSEKLDTNNTENLDWNNSQNNELNNFEYVEPDNTVKDSKTDNFDKINLKTDNHLNKKDEQVNYIKEIRDMIVYFAVVILIVLFVQHFVGEQVRVDGRSMESTLHNHERLILEKLSYRFGDPERFDIIVFQPYPDNEKELYIKRIIGLPGDKVQIIENDIYINDQVVEEDYGKEDTINDPGIAQDSIVLADDEYFVMGDNRNNSTDSRVIGPVKKSSILGRAWVRIWPFNKISVLEHK